jgi:CRISPR/Cas system-associated protein Cas10 (large subunit of type III CRISPR-Cas system)
LHKYSEFKFEDNQNFSASAGISIVKTKYPFYRAYKLAEELCNEAKKKARENPGSSYIDFFVSSGGVSGEIEEIRKKRFITPFGKLNFGPYVFGKSDEENSIKNLKDGIKHFQSFPKTKLMQLRDTIFNSTEEECRAFVNELEIKKHSLYKIKNHKYHEQIWQDNITPYYEIIEIIDFYPNELLEV